MSGETASTAEVSADNISLTNIPEGLAVSLDASSVTVNVFGTSDALSALNASSIKGTIDCTNLTVGESQTVVVQFENIEGVTIQNTSVTVTVIEDTSAATEDSEE